MAQNRPKIPEVMKRAIRRRCGYGCVICGKPICDYHHIFGFRADIGHIEAEICLLCDEHHRLEQDGMLSQAEVIARNSAAMNLQAGISSPQELWRARGPVECAIGNNIVHAIPLGGGGYIPVLMDGRAVCRIEEEDGNMLSRSALRFGISPSSRSFVMNSLFESVSSTSAIRGDG